MSGLKTDIDFDFEQECFDSECQSEIDCDPYRGCHVGFTIGPCNALNRVTREIDLSEHCSFLQLTDISFSSSQEVTTKEFYGSCAQRTRRGNLSYTIDISADVCENDPAFCRLLNTGCLVSWCMMPRGYLYDDTKPSSEQSGIFYGVARTGGLDWSFTWNDSQAVSTTLTGDGRYYRSGFCLDQPGIVNSAALKTPFKNTLKESKTAA